MFLRPLRLVAAVGLVLGLGACADQPTDPTTPARAASLAPPATVSHNRADEVIPHRFIVVFSNDVHDVPGLARQLTSAHGGKLHHVYEHALKGFVATLAPAAVAALQRTPMVAYIEPDRIAELTTTQTGASWGLDRVDQRDRPLNGNYDYIRTGFGVTVYVIDTGIDTSHPEFGGRASIGRDFIGDGNQDCNGHGTHVAGTIGSNTYGVAKAVSLVAVRVFACGNSVESSTVIMGLDWVLANAVKPAVANLSLRTFASGSMDTAVRNLINAGVTVVAAAGNDAGDACNYSPGRVSEAITVAASNSSDQPRSDSNQGSCVDLFAPGDDIKSTWPSGGTNTIGGTSMAAPHVAGAAALYLHGSPDAPASTVHTFLLDNATPNRMSSLGSGSPNRLLYTLATVDSYLRIRNVWQTGRVINNQTGSVSATTIQPYWWSAMWVFEQVPGTAWYRLRNRWTNQYLHAEYGTLQVGAIQPGWWSAMWILEAMYGSNWIRNRHTNTYLHIEYGNLQLGSIQSGWLSARWSLETAF